MIEIEKESLILKLLGKDKIFKEAYIATLFFVCDHNNNKNNIYIGLLDDSKVIYFYLFTKEKYIFQFLIEYENDDIMISEINDKIIQKGIITYLYQMGINFSKKEKQEDLIDIEMNKLGIFYKGNEKIDNFAHLQYSRVLEKNEANYYNNVIQCLVNIGPLKDIFLNRKMLYNKKIVQEYKKIILSFYKLMQYMWYWEPFKNNNEQDQSIIFMVEIQSLCNNDNIIKDIKLLIEFILLSIHYEYIYNGKIIYNINEIKKKVEFNYSKSIIKNIFFFDLLLDSQCKCNKNCYSTNYMLCLDIKQLSDKEQTIENILNKYKIKLTCNICKKSELSNIKFNSCPQVLIIYFEKQINNIKFKYENQMIIKYNNKEEKYELISIIKNRENKKNKLETFFNSSINKTWYKCNEGFAHEKMEINNLLRNLNNKNNNIPHLLIYQKLQK